MNVKVDKRIGCPHRFTITESIGTVRELGLRLVDTSLVTRITDGQQFGVGKIWVTLSDGEMSFGADNVIFKEVKDIVNKVRDKVYTMVQKYLEHVRFAEIFAEQKEIVGADKQ